MSNNQWYNTLSLEELDRNQWEALCDGCGKCCMLKINGPNGEQLTSNIACPLLNTKTRQCTDYPNRLDKISYCLNLTPEVVRKTEWLPDTCAYRLRAEDKPLYDWHPLVAGRKDLVPTIEEPLINLTMEEVCQLNK